MTQRRCHIVLVPGFAGFDALGQIEYYAGTTEVFRNWTAVGTPRRTTATLHYFDNVPSASVAERAARLRAFLAKRVARNEIQLERDTISLVGHSTGGLDIRKMVQDLAAAPNDALIVDKAPGKQVEFVASKVQNRSLLAMIEHVVFLSTPHAGTNIADFFDRFGVLSRLGLRAVKLGMTLTRAFPARLSQPALDALSALLGRGPLDLDAVLALFDAYREADEEVFAPTSTQATAAREAYAQFELWIDHMIANFQVIKDLKTTDEKCTRAKPNDSWPSRIVTRSYATISGDPSDQSSSATDWLYRFIHKRSSDGRFKSPTAVSAPSWFPPERIATLDDRSNDGIVNTLSMYFAGGGETFLVFADHGDVIGHYQRTRALREEAVNGGALRENRSGYRRFSSYDFFKSGSGFTEAAFYRLWTEIFTFCAEQTKQTAAFEHSRA